MLVIHENEVCNSINICRWRRGVAERDPVQPRPSADTPRQAQGGQRGEQCANNEPLLFTIFNGQPGIVCAFSL